MFQTNIFNGVVTFFSEPKPSILGQLRQEYVNATIQENGHLRAACAAEREALAAAFGWEPGTTKPIEFPSSGFLSRMEQAEQKTGTRHVKLFTP